MKNLYHCTIVSLALMTLSCSQSKDSTNDSLPHAHPIAVDRHQIDTPDTTTAPVVAVENNVEYVTQYMIVGKDGAGFNSEHISKVLKRLGFKVSLRHRPGDLDDMEEFTDLTASRTNDAGTTRVKYVSGEDPLCIIDFASMEEVDAFVQSLIASGYRKEGTLYIHPNDLHCKIFVRVRGRQVKIVNPWEMLPIDF